MKPFHVVIILFASVLHSACENEASQKNYTGTYCLNIQNLEMTIVQNENQVTFTLQNDLLVNGIGSISGDTLILRAQTIDSEVFVGKVKFSEDLKSFSGTYTISDNEDRVSSSGNLMGIRGECSTYDISSHGIPEFIETDFSNLEMIEKVSRFRSGYGHSFTDGTESCRSMKHYFSPYIEFRENGTVEIYSPVTGIITSLTNDGHGSSNGLANKMIEIRPDSQPAFICRLFHCDLLSAEIVPGKKVKAGDLLGYARLYYEDLEEYATSYDLAIWVNTPDGMRLVSYFDALPDHVFDQYISRGAATRDEFIITRETRDADPIQCDGESFLTSGNLENWVSLN